MSIKKIEDQFLWEEAYRPTTLADVMMPKKARQILEGYIEKGQLNNFLFYSQTPGTGKTTTARALCNDLGIRPLFINGSAQNSISDVRTLVREYATTASLMGGHKVVIIDEADRLSPAAQDGMKALIEEVSANCRFIFTSNSKSKIIEPLLSRLDVVEFVYDANDTKAVMAGMAVRMFEILDNEKVEFNKSVVAKVIQKYAPDNRKTIKVLHKYAMRNGTIDEGVLADIEATEVSTLVKHLKEKNFKEVLNWCANSVETINSDFYEVLYEGLKEHATPNSVPELILVLGDEQKVHDQVPSMYLHIAQTCVKIMMSVEWK